MAQLKQLLLDLKLSDKEVDLFISLVKLGKGTAAAVARESGITRTHVYGLITGLVEKGLVSEIEERGIKTYEPVDHAGLLAFVSREQKELQKIEKKLAEEASAFNALQVGNKEKTKVRFFNGVDGVKNIYAEIDQDLKKQEEQFEFLSFFSPEQLNAVIPDFQYFNSPHMKGREIVVPDKMIEEYKKQIGVLPNMKHKLWPKDRGLFPTDTLMWKNKLAYIDLGGYPSGIIVENESMAKSFKMWFDSIWDSLPSPTDQ